MTIVRRILLLVGGSVVAGILGVGCDQVSPTRTDGIAPRVSNLSVTPDTVRASVSDDSTEATIGIRATVVDPDGEIERAVVTLEPASAPERVRAVQLSSFQLGVGTSLGIQLPVEREVYTIRVFAVDNDSLTSNRGLAQFQLVPGA